MFDRPELSVMATSPANVFAMKIRAVGRDIDDFRLLAEIIGLNSAEEALHICAEFTWANPYQPDRLLVLRRIPGVQFCGRTYCGAQASPLWSSHGRVMRRAVRLLEWGLSEGSARRAVGDDLHLSAEASMGHE